LYWDKFSCRAKKINERLIALRFLAENLINDVADGCLFLTDKGESSLLRG